MADYHPVFRDNQPDGEFVKDDESALRNEKETAAAIGGGVYLAIIVLAILILALALVVFLL